jgi:hypothetical protein
MNKRMFFWLMPLALAGGVSTLLRADDSSPPAGSTVSLQDQATQAWLLDHDAAIDKDGESSGIWAVYQAADIMKDQPTQTSIDYFERMLYDAKDRGVQRAIRTKLVGLYRANNQDDKAMAQLEALMTDSE